VKSRYSPCVAQRVGTGIALLFHDSVTRRSWAVSSTPRPHFTPGKDPVPILQETEPNIILGTKSRRKRWAGHEALMGGKEKFI
jgi:hypothetical protein